MKQITSKKFKSQRLEKVQIVSDETWDWIVGQGWEKKYDVVNIERKAMKVPEITKPAEILTKTVKRGKKD